MALHSVAALANDQNQRVEVWDRLRSRPLFGAATALAARLIQMGSTLALVPILLSRLGSEQFAVWLAASSLMGAFSFIDLGIGSYLVNHIAVSKGASSSVRTYVSNAFVALTLFSAASATVVCLTFFSSETDNGLIHFRGVGTWGAFFLTCLTLCIVSPLSLIWKIRLGLGETAIESLWAAFASLATFCAIIVSLQFNAGIVAVVASFCAVPLLVHCLNAAQLFRRHPDLKPSLSLASAGKLATVLRSGAPFLLVNAISAISFSFDSVLALHLLDAEQAARFGVAQKMAIAVQTLLTIGLTPFWPQFRAATAEQNARSASRILISALSLALLIAGSVSTMIVLFGEDVTRLWTRAAISLPNDLIVGVAVWIPVFAVSAVLTSLMSVPSLLPVQVKLASLSGICCFVGKVALANAWGGPGLFWGNSFGLCAFLILPAFFVIARDLLRMKRPKRRLKVTSKTDSLTLKVAHFTEAPSGGVLAHLQELIAEQIEDPAISQITVFGPDVNDASLSKLAHPKLVIRSYPYVGRSIRSMIRFLFAARAMIQRFKPDIVHVHSTFAGLLVRPVAFLRKRRPTVIYCPHGWAFLRDTKANRLYAWLEAALSRLCDGVVCVSASEREAAASAGISVAKCTVILNGIAHEMVPPANSALRPRRPLKILFVGRFDRQKGFDVFLDVMSELGDLAQGFAVGNFVTDAATGLEVPENVELLGWKTRSQVGESLATADLLLMPSRWEGLPMIAIEAMRAGLPIFSSSVGGLPELVEDGVTGRLLKSLRPLDIANAIRATSNEELRGFANNAYQRFTKNYTAKSMADRTKQLYLDLLGSHDSPRKKPSPHLGPMEKA
jgi:glycosyltransferase involved in cell wall biosynthesis/O-antigen/teichoic acid export membrane protein